MTKEIRVYVLNGDEDSQKMVLQANIPFLLLYKKAVFTNMEDPTNDPYDDSDNVPVNEYYQRRVDENRVKKIKEFIRASIMNQKSKQSVAVLFPTAMLLAAQSSTDKQLKIGGSYNLTDIISDDAIFFIVDGQHRLYSMNDLYKEINQGLFRDIEDDQYVLDYLKNYVFNCTILLNYDLWEQAKVFADVNFTQKKVSPSLYYTIYGMNYSTEPSSLSRNYLYIAHQLVRRLNSHPSSPLKGFIKMLGVGSGFVSQAFVADALMRNIKSPNGIWYVDPYDMKVPPIYRYMTIEVLSFFSAVKNAFPDFWPKGGDPRSIICKTTGIGALLRLMAFFHQERVPQEILHEMRKMEESEICYNYEQFAVKQLKLLDDMKDDLFSLTGNYSGTGGKGFEVNLYREMRHKIIYPELRLFKEQTVTINGSQVGMKIYRTNYDFYTFELAQYYQNRDQMEPYRPGSGSIAKTIKELEYKIQSYISQIEPDARCVKNRYF